MRIPVARCTHTIENDRIMERSSLATTPNNEHDNEHVTEASLPVCRLRAREAPRDSREKNLQNLWEFPAPAPLLLYC
jgi:hypothetical protein